MNLEQDFPEAKEGVIRIYEGARQQIAENAKRPDAFLRFENLKNTMISSHQKLQDIDKLSVYLETTNKKIAKVETGSRNLTSIVSTLCQKVDNVEIIQMDSDVTSLAKKSVEVDKTLDALVNRPHIDLTPVG